MIDDAAVLATWYTPSSCVNSTAAQISSRHSLTAAPAGSSSWLTKPPGRHQSP
jgi:hypothetical protein